jgi:hypothetical protein
MSIAPLRATRMVMEYDALGILIALLPFDDVFDATAEYRDRTKATSVRTCIHVGAYAVKLDG